jgi:sugar/nucleoside kinase (ribokinase family)
MQREFLEKTLKKLKEGPKGDLQINTFVGLDGYIDLIQRPVKRQSENGPEYFDTITDFGQHLLKAAGKSGQVELVTQEKKLGGNAPIMAHSLGSLGFPTTCIGNFGSSDIERVFENMHNNVSLMSIGDPAMTNALEFHDGKIILSEVGPFKIQDWNHIKNQAGLERIIKKINESTLIALVDWCNLPYSTESWQGILSEVLPKLDHKPRHFFFDIADPSRRSDEEIKEALDTIGKYSSYGKITLGLNENETEKLYACLCRINKESEVIQLSLIDKAKYIFDHLNIWNLLVHPTNRSISIQGNQTLELYGRVVKKPKISTGGGDNFNAGYCLGQLLGFSLEECMIAGMANSGSYVQNGKSSNIHELINYIQKWLEEAE